MQMSLCNTAINCIDLGITVLKYYFNISDISVIYFSVSYFKYK